MENIAKIRQQLRQRRRAVSIHLRNASAQAATRNALKFIDALNSIDTVGIFLSSPEEIDTRPLIDALWQRNIRLYLPVVVKKQAPLAWRIYHSDTILKPDAMGILAPEEPAKKTAIPYLPTLIVMPLVGYDRKGYRIGMGGGYYDRTFSGKMNASCKTILLGFAYACQEIETTYPREWDVPMDALANELGLIIFRENTQI